MKDIRGTIVPQKRVDDLFTSIGKSEEECREFFGPIWEVNGFALYILDTWKAIQDYLGTLK